MIRVVYLQIHNIYKTMQNINDTQHPVKVGLSDAYIRDKSILGEYMKFCPFALPKF